MPWLYYLDKSQLLDTIANKHSFVAVMITYYTLISYSLQTTNHLGQTRIQRCTYANLVLWHCVCAVGNTLCVCVYSYSTKRTALYHKPTTRDSFSQQKYHCMKLNKKLCLVSSVTKPSFVKTIFKCYRPTTYKFNIKSRKFELPNFDVEFEIWTSVINIWPNALRKSYYLFKQTL